MKKRNKFGVIAILSAILVVGGIIGDLLIIENKPNSTWFFIVYILIVFIFMKILFKTNAGKDVLKLFNIK